MGELETWTFVGHWEDDRLVIEYVLAGEVPDHRENDSAWEQGLFAAAASGYTRQEAEQALRDEYEGGLNARLRRLLAATE